MNDAVDELEDLGPLTRSGLSVERLTPNVGVLVRGLDVDEALPDDDIDLLRGLVRAHHLVVLPDQILTSGEQVAFTRRFGPLTPASPLIPGLDHAHREVRVIDSRRWEGRNADWHANVTYMPSPPGITTCYARVVPTSGGDTEWASGELAYASLSAPLRALADQLEAVHDGSWLRPHLARYHERGLGTWDGERVEVTERGPPRGARGSRPRRPVPLREPAVHPRDRGAPPAREPSPARPLP